jgi:hypothetical protein
MGSFNNPDILMISFGFQSRPLHWLTNRLLPSDHTLLLLTTWLTGISLVWYVHWLPMALAASFWAPSDCSLSSMAKR